MKRTIVTLLAGIAIGAAVVAAPALGSHHAALAVETAAGRSGFIDVPRGQEARFLGTSTFCVNPKGQIPGGQVACSVNYRAPRSLSDLVPVKFDVGLTLRCVDLGKWSRLGPRLLKSARFC